MKIKQLSMLIMGILLLGSLILYAADHIDAPDVAGTSADITDFYSFQSPNNSSNLVFVVNVQGLLSPADTETASFDPNVMLQINIDTNNDLEEDLIIQGVFTQQEFFVYGPIAPSETGLETGVEFDANLVQAEITQNGEAPQVATNNSVQVFAGPRDDPFFFDFNRYTDIVVNGTESSFRNPGQDTFAGTNVLSLVIEVPKSQVGSSGTINAWAQAKRRIN